MERPQVGVAVIVLDGERALIGERRGSHGAGAWGLPGGRLEAGEAVLACARRELLEETGLEVGALRAGPFGSDVIEGQHWVTLFVIGERAGGEAELREPAKCARWVWAPWVALPRPLFSPLASLLASGFDPRG